MSKISRRQQGHGYRRDAADRCLAAFQDLETSKLFDLLPEMSVLRDERFLEPLLAMLKGREKKRREFGAMGLGALRDRRAIDPLITCLESLKPEKVRIHRSLGRAILQALGEIGSDQAAPFISSILERSTHQPDAAAWQNIIVQSLGRIAQQEGFGAQALQTLTDLAGGRDVRLCLLAIPEIAVAFWHRPKEIPDSLLQLLVDRSKDEVPEIQWAAFSAIENLARLGCPGAAAAIK